MTENKKKKAAFLDLDGTFWDREVVPESAMEAVKKARENGHLVFVNTGRIRDSIPDFLWDMNLDGYILATGMDLYKGHENIARYEMDPEKVKRIEEYLKEHACGYSLNGVTNSWDDPKFAFRRQVFNMKQGKPETTHRISLEREDNPERKGILKVNFDTDIPFSLDPLIKAENLDILLYANRFNPFNGFGSYFRGELTDRDHDKSKAMHEMLKHFGGDYEIIAFGDSENDIPAFGGADLAVCMGNGTDRAKQAADLITDSIDRDGLYKAFKRLGMLDPDPITEQEAGIE